MNKKVSIIVPVYNVSGTIEGCVKSIRKQSYSNLEIILVDDGAKDNSGEICDNLAKEDVRIKVIHQENAGVPMARNAGLRLATGEYVCFVDSDDEVTNNYVEKMVDAMENTNSELVVCGIALYEKRRTTFIVEPDYTIELDRMVYDTYIELFSKFILIPVWNKLYVRRIIEEYDLWFDKTFTACGEDGPFVVNYLRHCNKVTFINEELYHYFCYHSNSSARFWPLECQIKFFEIKKEFLEERCINSKDVEKYCVKKSLHNLRDRMRDLIMKNKWNRAEYIKCYDYYWQYVEPYIENEQMFKAEDWEWLNNNKTLLLNKDIDRLYKRCKKLYAVPWKKALLRKLKEKINSI